MWPRPPVTERRDPDGRSTRVGYALRRCGFEKHCGIVTRVCLVRGGRRGEATTVVTASRDGTLKCWDTPASVNETHGGAVSSTAPPPQLRCSLEEHTAWVNDAVVLQPSPGSTDASRDSRRIVSASNDNLLKVWHLDEERQGAGVSGALMSLRYHVDYVTCLAYAPHRSLLVSAGLDSRVVVSDLEAATRVLTLPTNDTDEQYGHRQASSSPHRGGNAQAQAAQRCAVGSFSGAGQYIPQLLVPSNHTNRESGGYSEDTGGGREGGSCGASVWSLATTRNASLLACGTASCVVRGWDPRSGARLWRLRGHTENVRALVMSDDGTICISGSADRTVRVWDVGMRRCVHVFDAHHDSVWALGVAGYSCGWANTAAVDGTGGMMDKVFSGGRDGLVLVHDLRLLSTGLVVREPSPLQALAVPSDPTEIWAAAADSHVRRHPVPASLVPYSPAVSRDDTVPPGAAPVPVAGQIPVAGDDCIAIAGTPRLIDYKVLHNKRQVLVRDACDQLSLWDVTNGQFVDFPIPGAPSSGSTTDSQKIDDVIKRALAQVNKPISVPNWFTCDLSLGSLSVYLDANQCFKAESEEDTSLASSVAATRLEPGRNTGGIARNGQVRNVEANAPINLGARTLRTLFESWVRLPVGIAAQAAAANQVGGRSNATGNAGQRRAQSYPRVFVIPTHADTSGQGGALAQRWDDDQPPGTPADQACPTEAPTGNVSAPSFPPATGLFLVGRNGRSVGYRGRLYCGLFNGTEAPELLPPWVVDVVWNQRPPPEELCGERMMLFSLMRCPSELALPPLQTPFCAAAPRTHVRRLMGYLVRALDFDWEAPAKTAVRRQGSAVSLVSRLGRCCTVPTSRGRANSGDWSSDGGETPGVSNHRHVGNNSARRNSNGSRERTAAYSNHNASQRRAFGLRRGEEEVGANVGVAARVRIDGSPSPLPSVPAGQNARRGGATVAVSSGGAVPDERFVEIVCNDTIVDPDMSLATVRDFLWRRPGHEMVLCYRRAARAVMPTSPAPPPPLLSPGGQNVNATINGATRSDEVGLTEDVTSELNGVENHPPGHEVEGSLDPECREDGPPRE